MNPEELEPVAGAVEEGIVAADTLDATEAVREAKRKEEAEVKRLWKEYEDAREFDKEARAQYAVDRRYAAGTANPNWAVTANLIGAFIDILVSFLYARNPDVSVKKAPRVSNSGTRQEDDFAKTLQLVISTLWKAPRTGLKATGRRQVRSGLSVGVGWFKAILVSNGTNIPQMRAELSDIRNNLAAIEAARVRLAAQSPQPDPYAPTGLDPAMGAGLDPAADPGFPTTPAAPAVPPPPAPSLPEDEDGGRYDSMSEDEIAAEEGRLRDLEASVQNRLEVAIRKGLAVDFVAAEDMQVATDVRSTEEYLNAGWCANRIYRPTCKLRELFPRLTEGEAKQAKCYYQRKNTDTTPLADRVAITGLAGSDVNADEAEQYTTESQAGGGGDADSRGVSHACIVELWNRETGHVYTMVDGVKRWAKEPYQPDYPTTRFYPYFRLAFYEVEGARHPQSLSWRLAKLQDEYAASRSSLRLTRQRSIPGVLFNETGMDAQQAQKLSQSTHGELIGLKPTNPDQPLRELFAEKPVSGVDMRLYDTAAILADMERISGVQEALQQSSTAPKTATEAEIQQSGFASRTTADRDTLETMMTDFAQYTAELSLSALDMTDAQRIAGASSFWPAGMAIDDLLTMVEVHIEAGTSGKPRSSGDKDAWGVVMPLLKQTILEIRQAMVMGDMGMVESLTEIIRETMVRMGDETDVDRFIPPPLEQAPPMPGMPGVPGMPGDPMAGGDPPMDGLPPEAVPDAGAGAIVAPDIVAPELVSPV